VAALKVVPSGLWITETPHDNPIELRTLFDVNGTATF
jgi:hypothetical protein